MPEVFCSHQSITSSRGWLDFNTNFGQSFSIKWALHVVNYTASSILAIQWLAVDWISWSLHGNPTLRYHWLGEHECLSHRWCL